MDNVTHTLIGVTLAMGVSKASDDSPPRNQAILTSIVASNLADFDFLAAWWYGGGNLGYLMQHRGWSHTMLLSPVIAAISLMIMSWITGRRVGEPTRLRSKRREGESEFTRILRGTRRGYSKSDPQVREMRRTGRKRLFFLAWAAVLLHLFADSWNDYGIHPFAPFDNGWLYGDFIFIIEPLLWIAMIPLIFFEFQHRWAKIATGVVLALSAFITLLGSQGGFLSFLGVAAWTGAAYVIHKRFGERFPRAAIVAAFACVTLVVFWLGSVTAGFIVRGNLSSGAQNEHVQQIVLSPFPANPLLWRTIAVTTGVDHAYIVRIGTVSLMPWLHRPPKHLYGVERERMATLIEPTQPSGSALHWLGEFRASSLDYVSYASRSCEFHTLLKFARAPFWHRVDGRTFAGDMRYDQEKGLGFSKVELKDAGNLFSNCPDYDSPWEPPIPLDKLSEFNKSS